jgi:hypothetical protein
MKLLRVHLLFLLVCAASMHAFCQQSENSDIRDITKLNFLGPGISYEKRIGRFQSLHAQAYIATSVYFSYSSTFGTDAGVFFDPAFALQYRFYYNAAKREAKGKRIEMNSLNYVGAVSQLAFYKNETITSYYPEKERQPSYTFGVIWGFQRNYLNRFSLDFNIGLGYSTTKTIVLDQEDKPVIKNAGEFAPVSQLGLGFWLNKRE